MKRFEMLYILYLPRGERYLHLTKYDFMLVWIMNRIITLSCLILKWFNIWLKSAQRLGNCFQRDIFSYPNSIHWISFEFHSCCIKSRYSTKQCSKRPLMEKLCCGEGWGSSKILFWKYFVSLSLQMSLLHFSIQCQFELWSMINDPCCHCTREDTRFLIAQTRNIFIIFC